MSPAANESSYSRHAFDCPHCKHNLAALDPRTMRGVGLYYKAYYGNRRRWAAIRSANGFRWVSTNDATSGFDTNQVFCGGCHADITLHVERLGVI